MLIFTINPQRTYSQDLNIHVQNRFINYKLPQKIQVMFLVWVFGKQIPPILNSSNVLVRLTGDLS